MDTGVLPTDLVRAVARVVREGLDEPQFRVELAQVVALEIDVQVCVDPDEALRLVPALNVRVVARPRLEPLSPRAWARRSASSSSADAIPSRC